MHSSQDLAVHARVPARHSRAGRPKGVRLLKALLAAAVKRSSPPQGSIDPSLDGYAWCDSLERQVTFDIANCRRTWLF